MKRSSVLLLTILCCVSARADPVIYDRNSEPPFLLFGSDAAPEFPSGHSQYVADPFALLPGASTITGVHWTGGYLWPATPTSPGADNFTVQIYEGSGGPAATALQTFAIGDVGRTEVGTTADGATLYAYSVSISPLSLMANREYWISIFNDTTGLDYQWGWRGDLALSEDYQLAQRMSTDMAWDRVEGRLDFQLTGIAEPATLALLALALAGLGFARRRPSCPVLSTQS